MDSTGRFSQARRAGKLSKLVARELLEDVASGGLTKGARLGSEAELMDRFGVGRASVREGLRILESHGVISIRPGPGGGPVVDDVKGRDFGRMATLFFHLSGTTYAEVIEARLVMDPVMARLAALRSSAVDRQRLHAATRLEREKASDPTTKEVGEGFHSVVASMSGNRVMDLYGRGLTDVYYAVRTSSRLVYPAHLQDHVRSVHSEIVAAIERQDPDAAESLMRSHMEELVEFTREKYPEVLSEVVEWL